MASKEAKALFKSPIGHALKRLTRATEEALKKQKTWAVYTETYKWGRRVNHKTFFRVGVQYFVLAENDDRKEGLHQCKFIAKMFLIALKNLGVDVRKRKRK